MVLEDVWQITANPHEADKFNECEGIPTDQWLDMYFELRDEAENVTPPPLVDPGASPPLGPPPGCVKSENYWVREKIILTSASEPPASATQKSSGKRGKKNTKTGK
jgi:hypothetical protein